MELEIKCDRCGKTMHRYPSRIHEHNFCSRQCLADFSSRTKNPEKYAELKPYGNMSKHMTALNQRLNPARMTPNVRAKLRVAHLGTGAGKSYAKLYGRHEHRVIAEQMLGRPLHPGEVVHHLNGDPRNNAPSNLYVFRSQREHANMHRLLGDLSPKGGDAQ